MFSQKEMIDLRSDTVTKPTPEMLKHMFAARVGDDVFNEDPTVFKLQDYAASLFNVEASLFCPSGTMTNQIALFLLSGPLTEVLLHPDSHVYQYEGGGLSFNARTSVKFIAGERGKILASDIKSAINPQDVHRPRSSVVSIENTTNRGGGACYSLQEMKEISQEARRLNLNVHMDGARLMNALIAQNIQPEKVGPLFDTISLCLSKGLGAPVGSLILGSKELIQEARRVRKVMGGGMRQVGYLAAAGLFALENNVQRLATDHQHAKMISQQLEQCSWVERIFPVETNIVIFQLQQDRTTDSFIEFLKQKKIQVLAFGPQLIRMVLHLDISSSDIQKILLAISEY